MSPKIVSGDMVVTCKNCQPKVGDIITFKVKGKNYITHRIIAIKDGIFITKGDQNNTLDTFPILSHDIVGKMLIHIPTFFIRFSFGPKS